MKFRPIFVVLGFDWMCEDDDNFLCGVILDFGIFSLSDLMGVEILRVVLILEDQFLGGSGQIRYYGNVSLRLEVENEDIEVIQNRLRNLQDRQFRYVPQHRIWYVINLLMALIGEFSIGLDKVTGLWNRDIISLISITLQIPLRFHQIFSVLGFEGNKEIGIDYQNFRVWIDNHILIWYRGFDWRINITALLVLLYIGILHIRFSIPAFISSIAILKTLLQLIDLGFTMSQSQWIVKSGGKKGEVVKSGLRVTVPRFDNSELIASFSKTLIGRCMNPQKQDMKILLFMLPRIWNVEGRVVGTDLGLGVFSSHLVWRKTLWRFLRWNRFISTLGWSRWLGGSRFWNQITLPR